MSRVRILVGTRKGAFILDSDGSRRDWQIRGPEFGGWEVLHLTGSPADPDRLYASQWTAWFGQLIQRSDDGGRHWRLVGRDFSYEGDAGIHQSFDGSAVPWEFSRVWHLQPSGTDPDTVFAGVQDAALFTSVDKGRHWNELSGLRQHGSGAAWQPGAGGLCLHTIIIDPSDPDRIWVAVSAAGVFGTDDAGKSWHALNRGLRSDNLPDPNAEVGHCVHHLAMHPSAPDVLYMQKHWHVMRSDDGGRGWRDISGDLPSSFGFPIEVHAHEPETVYVVPITSDSEHYPPEGKLRVYRTRAGGCEWEPLTRGLPQEHCYVNVLRDAMATDALDPCGVYFGTTAGDVFVSADEGDTWGSIVHGFPAVLSVEVQTLP